MDPVLRKAPATIPEKFRIFGSVWADLPLNERAVDNLLHRLSSEEKGSTLMKDRMALVKPLQHMAKHEEEEAVKRTRW
jgi:hypothetical protein